MISAHSCLQKAQEEPNPAGSVAHGVGVVRCTVVHQAVNFDAVNASLATRDLHNTTQDIERAERFVLRERELGLSDSAVYHAQAEYHVGGHNHEGVLAMATLAG
ncbi:MAG: hypothetical protein ACREGE_04475 [Candidatus Microsaccharimonas sp.]